MTDEQALGGTRSWVGRDTAGLSKPFHPYTVLRHPPADSGVLRIGFDVRLDAAAPAGLMLELRDHEPAKVNGTRVEVAADGGLTAGGESLVTLSAGGWTRIELNVPLGPDAPREWEVLVRNDDGPRTWLLPLAAGFDGVDWTGILAPGETDGRFFLDNLLWEVDHRVKLPAAGTLGVNDAVLPGWLESEGDWLLSETPDGTAMRVSTPREGPEAEAAAAATAVFRFWSRAGSEGAALRLAEPPAEPTQFWWRLGDSAWERVAVSPGVSAPALDLTAAGPARGGLQTVELFSGDPSLKITGLELR